MIAALGAWFFPSPFGAVTPRFVYRVSPDKFLAVEMEFGELQSSLPFCYKRLDEEYQGDDFFRTYYFWGYAREKPEEDWSFYMRKVQLKRIDTLGIHQWYIRKIEDWRHYDPLLYKYDEPRHHLTVPGNDLPGIKENCGDRIRDNWRSDAEIREEERAKAAEDIPFVLKIIRSAVIWYFSNFLQMLKITHLFYIDLFLQTLVLLITFFLPSFIILLIERNNAEMHISLKTAFKKPAEFVELILFAFGAWLILAILLIPVVIIGFILEVIVNVAKSFFV